MSSLVPGFEYDVFISYRHNDNLDGWVTDFVEQLQRELRTTIKEPLSIYFDKNPHDGLLETYSVDRSLEGKLKCIIFIPIISQTYCDSKSFAWQHEFCAFNAIAKADVIGREIKLSNGNVASRILPIKIHDLDAGDVTAIEKELDSPLRGIEFIYREPGVNRPLRSGEEGQTKNLARTVYRNQLNKVAHAIKQIETAVNDPTHTETASARPTTQLQPKRKTSRILAISFLALVAALGYFGIMQRQSVDAVTVEADKSIAVLPFVNMSNDPEQEYFSDGVSEEILNLLAKVPELKVIGRTSSFYFKGKNEDLRIIGEKLGAAYVLEGSLRKEGKVIRITAQLIKASDGTHLWSETFERKLENIFKLQDEIASNVLEHLKLKLLVTTSTKNVANQDVYNLILKGRYFIDAGKYAKGLGFYEEALALDSSEAIVWTSLSQARAVLGTTDFRQFEENFKLVRRYAERALSIDESFSDAHRALGLVYLFHDLDFDGARQELNIAIQLDPNNSDAYRNLGILEASVGNLDAALVATSKSVDLNPLSTLNLSNLAAVYVNQRNFGKAEQILIESLEIGPSLEKQLVGLFILSGETNRAQKLFDKALPDWDPNDREITQALITYTSGKKVEALESLRKVLKHYEGNSYRVADAFAFMNERDDAFKWLSKAHDEKFRILAIKNSMSFQKFRDDPRYIALLKKMNIPL